MASNLNHVDQADKLTSIPLEEMNPTENIHRTHGNIDDGLLGDGPNSRPADPDVNEPGEVDELEPGDRREPPHQPRPTPGPRPEFPVISRFLINFTLTKLTHEMNRSGNRKSRDIHQTQP